MGSQNQNSDLVAGIDLGRGPREWTDRTESARDDFENSNILGVVPTPEEAAALILADPRKWRPWRRTPTTRILAATRAALNAGRLATVLYVRRLAWESAERDDLVEALDRFLLTEWRVSQETLDRLVEEAWQPGGRHPEREYAERYRRRSEAALITSWRRR